jgi:cysteine-rich repeat protein
MTDTIPPVSTEIFSSTLTDNHATSNEGGGVGMSGGDPGNINLAIKNTILAGNTAVTEGDDCSNDDGGSGTIDSLGYNLVGDDDECSGEFAATGDQAGTSSTPLDVKLGDLAINGGSTPTHGLLAGSPALDGALAGCTDEIGGFLATDQRGFARVVGAACDIGAFEAGTCGDGGLDLGEECDDGNNSDGDGCQADCVLPICGDGILDPGENCDDGSGAPLTDCRTCGDPACGDGMINGGETCDDGNLLSGDGCSNLCLEETDSSGGCAFSAVTGKPGGVPVILILLVPIFLVFRYRGRHAAT